MFQIRHDRTPQERRVAGKVASTNSADPKPAAIVGAAFACMTAARTYWLESDQQQPFGEYLDDVMSIFHID